MESENSDSLFDGMEFFNPEALAVLSLPKESEASAKSSHESIPFSHQNPNQAALVVADTKSTLDHVNDVSGPPDSSLRKADIESASEIEEKAHIPSEPLDESLFSGPAASTTDTVATSVSSLSVSNRPAAAPVTLIRKKKRMTKIGLEGKAAIDSASLSYTSSETATDALPDDDASNIEEKKEDETTSDLPAQGQYTEAVSAPAESMADSVVQVQEPELEAKESNDADGSMAASEEGVAEKEPQNEAAEEEIVSATLTAASGGDPSLEMKAKRAQEVLDVTLSDLKAEEKQLLDERRTATARKREAARKKSDVEGQVKNLEQLVSNACDAEDFELADELSQQLEAAEKEMESLKTIADVTDEILDNINAKLRENERAAVAAIQEAARNLRSVAEEASKQAAASKEELLSSLDAELDKISSEEEVLETKCRKLGFEKKVIDQEWEEYHRKVNDSTKEERQERDELLDTRSRLAFDLEELKRKVADKQAELDAQDEKIWAVDRQIGAVASKFEKVRVSLESEEQKWKEEEVILGEQRAEIEKRKEEIEQAKTVAVEEEKMLLRVVEEAGDSARQLEERGLENEASKKAELESRSRVNRLIEREKNLAEESRGIKQSMADFMTELQELGASRKVLEVDVEKVEHRLAHADVRIPQLEADKKLAASSRNFKEAAKLSAEAKLLINDREAASKELESLKQELQGIDSQEEAKKLEMVELESFLKDAEKQTAIAVFLRLKMVAAMARKEMERAVEAEEFEEAESLNFEVEASEKEAESLQISHGFTDEEIKSLEGEIQ